MSLKFHSAIDVQEFVEPQRYFGSPAGSKVPLLPDILRNAAAQTEETGGVLCRGVEASYADVDALSGRLAGRLAACGVRKGDRVLLLLSNSLEFVTSCFAVWKAGAILVPEDPAIKDENLRHI